MSAIPESRSPMPGSDLRWRFCRFDALTLRELQLIHMARQEVFVVEQQCAFLDADGLDEPAFHLAAWSPMQPEPLAYARLLDPGLKYPEASVGRILTTAAARGCGLGRELVARALAHAAETWPGTSLRIAAQARLARFYEGFGFVAAGASFLEDGIEHIEMIRAGSGR